MGCAYALHMVWDSATSTLPMPPSSLSSYLTNLPVASYLPRTAALPSQALGGRSVLAMSGVAMLLLPVVCVAVGLQQTCTHASVRLVRCRKGTVFVT